ncbi:MAG: hypothetical protein ACLTAR_10415, partial [Proteus mirabilis]
VITDSHTALNFISFCHRYPSINSIDDNGDKITRSTETWQVFRNIFLAEEGSSQHIAGLTEDQR